ncbi:hypothetical protein HUG17_10079 [Dermatophagoides farinae]|uniref:TIMELESS-interacting protein n=1 Tax=Dermatophagoides farinae TaxID=6954 RepID=A0A9D4SJ07_DERFA|nr:hypothetical protein HUG17_10079 [Dermatophagoides farinae]
MDYDDLIDEPSNVDNNESTTNDSQPKSTVVNPKTPIIRRPRNILRVDHLVSRRGIAALPQIISQTKFKGKGHELEDLKLLLFKTKHWAHRLFPGLTFEDFVAKTEQFGNKRPVKNFLNRIRTNEQLYFADDHNTINSDNDGDDDGGDQQLRPKEEKINDNNDDGDQAAKNFDLLFRDHIEEMKINMSNNKDYDDDDDDGTNGRLTTTITMLTTKENQNHHHHVDNNNDFMEDDDEIDYDDLDIVASSSKTDHNNEKQHDGQTSKIDNDAVDDHQDNHHLE